MGGTERHLLQLTSGLKNRGWLVSVVTINDRNPLQKQFEDSGVIVRALELPVAPKWMLLPLRKLWLGMFAIIRMRKVLKNEPMPIHFFLPHSYFLGMAAYFLSGTKQATFMSRRSLNNYQKKLPGSRCLESLLHRRVTALFGNSEAVINQLVEEGADPKKTNLIYNGVDSEKIAHEQGSKSLSVKADVLIYCIGNFIPYKGHLDLIQALAYLKSEQCPTWHVVCFGRDDGILPLLKKQAIDNGIATHFSWIENETEPWRFITPGNIGVLPSHQEGFSNAVLEMMACGLAVIATDVGGNPEALDSGAGITVPPSSAYELKNEILNLLKSDTVRVEYARRAKSRVQQKFSIPACVDSYEKIYNKYMFDNKLN
jgi:glycosyltransferase involved in cell wall biosynthesis